MIGSRIIIKRGSKEEAEKPFWISFSDLMSALMVLFLVVMSVALLAVTKKVTEEELAKAEREKEINELLDQVKQSAKKFDDVHVVDKTINFGKKASFETASSKLSNEDAQLLRKFVPEVLGIANSDLGQKWLKRIVVEGYTDRRGSYLYNLNLSLNRSQRVLCSLLSAPAVNEHPLTDDEKDQIRLLFFVGGYSFNSAKESDEESRRIELKLEFRGIEELPRGEKDVPLGNYGICAI